MVFACRRPHFSLLRQRKVSKRKGTRFVPDPARFGKWPSFRRDIHVSTSLKRTSCAFSSHFPPVLGELVWERKSKAKSKSKSKSKTKAKVKAKTKTKTKSWS